MSKRTEEAVLKRRNTNGQKIWKKAQYHYLSGKCKSKQQWDMSFLSEWLTAKSAGEGGNREACLHCLGM